MKYRIVILLLFISVAAFAQKQDNPLIQFTGIIHNSDSVRVVIPYVNITNLTSHDKVNVSNYQGYFSFVVHERDSIKFTCVGYASVTIAIPANLGNKSYTMQVLMKPRMINLPVFRVFPWATTDEFTQDFLTMKLADDALEIARKNLSLTSIQRLERTLPLDGSEEFNAQDMHNSIMNSHSITNPLLNPFAWGALIKEISDGDKSRSSGN
jgi:hypothetical protein